jgi:hypothetical protein
MGFEAELALACMVGDPQFSKGKQKLGFPIKILN